MKLPFVSIVFPNLNGGKEPLECLTSIKKLSYPQERLETIVVDNASTDGSDKQIKKQFPHTILIKQQENKGFSLAINIGIAHAKGDYIFIGNDDLTFARDSLTILIDYMKMHPDVGITGGKILYKNNRTQVASAGYMFNRWTGNVYRAPDENIQKEPDWIQGCALLIRKSVLEQLDNLDEGFSLGFFEDVDLCVRAKKLGHKIVYLPQAQFYHGVTTTMNKNLQLKYFQWYKNKIRFILIHLSWIQLICILSLQCMVIMPVHVILLRDKRLMSFIKAVLWNVHHISETLQKRKVNFV